MVHIGIVGFFLDTLGKLLVAYTSIMVHHRFREEHKVDERVFLAMRREQKLGLFGMGLILVGASMELLFMMRLI